MEQVKKHHTPWLRWNALLHTPKQDQKNEKYKHVFNFGAYGAIQFWVMTYDIYLYIYIILS